MTKLLIAAVQRDMAGAARLGAELDAPLAEIEIHHFPDGESLVRASGAAETVIVYCPLDHPNEKLIELGLACSALRDMGAKRLVLVAPYLCYMRQDMAFHAGEAVAQHFVGRLLGQWFDRIVTIEPHLHRVLSLAEVFPRIETTALSAAGLLARWVVGDDISGNMLIVGPDEESERWTSLVSKAAKAPFITLKKKRSGDRDVVVSARAAVSVAGKHVYLVDDIVATGATLAAAARLLKENGASRIDALIVHALFSEQDGKEMFKAGVDTIRSTDTVTNPTNAAIVAPLLASALEKERV